MARRTPEEILAQREAWMARKAAREAGQDVPIQPPLKPGEVAETPAAPEASAEPEVAQPEQSEVAQPAPEPQPEAETQPQVEVAAPPSDVGAPQRPAGKRTPEEILAQREAWMARKAAKAAGQAPPPPPAPAPAAEPVAAAPQPAAKPAPAPKAAKPTPKPKAAAKPAPRKKAAPAPQPIDPNITRRELLNYAWLASIGLFSLQAVGATLWFAFPNFKEGEFGGLFPIGPAESVVPEVNSPPVPYTDGKFWLVNLDTENAAGELRKGILALFKVCTHLGCLYNWADVTFRFECPCHGSRFELTGDYIAGPARRSLDRLVIIARSPDGTEKQTDAEGNPLVIDGDEELIIDTGQIIRGSSDIIPA